MQRCRGARLQSSSRDHANLRDLQMWVSAEDYNEDPDIIHKKVRTLSRPC